MPLGIVSDDIFDNHVNNTPDISGAIKEIERGRGKGSVEVPEEIRNIIGGTAIEEGNSSAKEIARAFGINEGHTSAYKNGATSLATYNKKNEKLSTYLNKVRNRVSVKASRNLLRALDSMTPDKLDALDPTDAATVAKAMSGVIKDVTPETKESGPRVQFQIYAPSVHTSEQHYNVVRVEE